MERELSRGDIVNYIWYSRDFIIRSKVTPQIFSFIEFCPWCSKYLTKYSLRDEYEEEHKKRYPTYSDNIMPDSHYEEFQENFLRNWEKENQTLEKNLTTQYNKYNLERLKQFLDNAKDQEFVVPKALTLSTFQTEKIIYAIIDKAGLESTEQAWTLLAIIFQKGGTTKQCDENLEAEVQGKKLRLKTVRDCMKGVGLPRMERRLARFLATQIYKVCSSLNISGNLARAILNNETTILTNVTNEDKVWMSDFQNDNEDCPERIRQLISNHLKTKKQS